VTAPIENPRFQPNESEDMNGSRATRARQCAILSSISSLALAINGMLDSSHAIILSPPAEEELYAVLESLTKLIRSLSNTCRAEFIAGYLFK
jgi:hypothetical protein